MREIPDRSAQSGSGLQRRGRCAGGEVRSRPRQTGFIEPRLGVLSGTKSDGRMAYGQSARDWGVESMQPVGQTVIVLARPFPGERAWNCRVSLSCVPAEMTSVDGGDFPADQLHIRSATPITQAILEMCGPSCATPAYERQKGSAGRRW